MKTNVIINGRGQAFRRTAFTSLAAIASLALLVTACDEDAEEATPTGGAGATAGGAAGKAGAGAGGAAAGKAGAAGAPVAGAGGAPVGGAGGAPVAGAAGAPVAGSGGTAGSAGTAGQAGSGTAGSAGTAGQAGSGGTAGSAGTAGQAGTAGAGGTTLATIPESTPVPIAFSATGHDRLYSVNFNKDGVAYAVGHMADTTEATADYSSFVAKLKNDGTLDTSWATGGIAKHNITVGTNAEFPRGIVIQDDGKIIFGTTVEHIGGDALDKDIAVVRLLTTGELDTTWGTGGIATLDLSTGKQLAGTEYSADQQYGLAMQPDGKIIVSGAQKNATRDDKDHAVARLGLDGKLDPTFGTNGVFTLDVDMQGADPRTVTILPDGHILASGYSKKGDVTLPIIMKLTSAGVLDPTFGTAGVFSDGTIVPNVLEVYGTILQGTKLVTIGYGKTAAADSLDWISIRLTGDGKLDPTYATGGVLKIDQAGFNDNGRGIVALPDGRTLFLGKSSLSATDSSGGVAVYTADGQPDTTFGPGGKRLHDLGGSGDQYWVGRLAPDAKRVVIVGVKVVTAASASPTVNDDSAVLTLELK